MGRRENKSATTFWMLDEVKKEAKDKARLMGTTLTDLINNAVAYYIENLEDIDPQAAIKQIGREIKDAPKINQMEKDIKDLQDKFNKISKIDDKINSISDELEALRENMEGEYLQSKIRTHIDAKVGTTLEDLQRILQKLG